MLRSILNIPYLITTPIEDLSRQDTTVGNLLNIACFQTLADRVWTPFQLICFNPGIAFVVLLVLYIIFNIIFLPLWGLSFLISTYGSIILFLIAFHYLIIYITRLIAFPGASISTQKQISQDFLKRLLLFLENVATHSGQYSSTVMLIANGKLPIQELYMNMNELQKILLTIEYLPNVLLYLKDTMDFLKAEKLLEFNEIKLIQDLHNAIEVYYQSFHYLYHFLNEEYYHISSHHHAINLGNQNFHHQQKNNRLLLSHASKCLKSSEGMRLATLPLKVVGGGGTGNEEDDENNQQNAGIAGVLKLILSFRENIKGFEHITLPYMRSILSHKYGAKSYLIKGSNDNLIDGIFICSETALSLRRPAKQVAPTTPSVLNRGSSLNNASNFTAKEKLNSSSGDSVRKESSSHTPKGGSSQSGSLSIKLPEELEAAEAAKPKGLVIFCNPNAALYETVSQQEYENSWLGFYVSLGYDVFFYNYRGYGRSEGSPTPKNLREDGLKVMEFLFNEFAASHQVFLVHGQSIGGMIACHIASKFPKQVSGLICDRTFGSLDATASRLMGNWAGNFMKYGALWSTNVVMDFLNVPCPKLVLQDPNDEIIYESASLKAGIASKVCLNDVSITKPGTAYQYNLAYFLKEDVPNGNLTSDILKELGPKEEFKLTEKFIVHFYYCCLRLGYLSSLDHPATDIESENSHNIRGDAIIGQIEMIQRKGGLSSSQSPQVTEGDKPKHQQNLKKSLDKLDGKKSGSHEDQHAHRGITPEQPAQKKAKLEDYLNLKMTDQLFEGKYLNPYKKAYVAIFRTHNGCDFILGNAISRGMDYVQSWLTTYLCWNNKSIKNVYTIDNIKTPKGAMKPTKEINKFFRKSVHDCIQDLKQIRDELHNDVLGKCPEINFIIQGLEMVFDKNEYFHNGGAVSAPSAISGETDVESAPLIKNLTSSNQVGAKQAISWSNNNSTSENWSLNRCTNCFQPSVNHILSVDAKPIIGELLPVHCGHNGWLHSPELKFLKSWLSQHSLKLDSSDDL